MPIRCDYHMHTPLCRHAAGPLEDYVEQAITRGLSEIGFADHNPLPDGRGANVRMAEAELEYYVACVQELQTRYRDQITIRLGLELDYVPDLTDYLDAQVRRYPWDYIIGSVHYFDPDCRIGSWSRHFPGTADEQYQRYFERVGQLARAGLCDIIAHLDVVKRSGRQPGPAGLAAVSETLREIAASGLCLEINTSGYRHPELPEPQPYPSWNFIAEAVALGIPLTVNSDAHAPDQVGMMFAEVEGFLREQGCRHLWQFAGRQRRAYAL